MDTLRNHGGIRFARGRRYHCSIGHGWGGKPRAGAIKRESGSGEWSDMPARYEGRSANSGRRQFSALERQTRPIEGRHLPARWR